jgi:hypothetical protein
MASVFARRDYADVSDEPETSRLKNSIAAQEFGSDYTDLYDDRAAAGLTASFPSGGNWLGIEGAFERQRSLLVHASPASGQFQPTINAEPLRERRLTLSLTRPTSLTALGFEAAGRLALTGLQFHSEYPPGAPHLFRGTIHPRLFRPTLSLNLERPFGDTRLVLHTFAASVSGGLVPVQHLVYLGGPTSAPGYDFHQFVSSAGFSQRAEWRFHAPFFSIPLGQYGRVPGEITLAPFVNDVWLPDSPNTQSGQPGWHPSAGLGVISLFDLLRFDVAKGFRNGRWTFSADFGRAFWSVL